MIIDASPQSYYGGRKWKNGDKNFFSWENEKAARWSELDAG